MNLYYDREGNPMELMAWALKFEDADYTCLAADYLASDDGDHVWVSTVWLGLNHNWGDGPPLIFETMIFGGAFDQWQDRYPTEAAARAGHDQAVAMVKESSVKR